MSVGYTRARPGSTGLDRRRVEASAAGKLCAAKHPIIRSALPVCCAVLVSLNIVRTELSITLLTEGHSYGTNGEHARKYSEYLLQRRWAG
jgi:hypothetical protein